MIYPPRERFCEFNALESEIAKVGSGIPISLTELRDCDLKEALHTASNMDLTHLNYTTAQSSIIDIIESMYSRS